MPKAGGLVSAGSEQSWHADFVAEVRIVQVDERDNNWERYDPQFRVYLHGSSATSTYGWTATYDVTGADLLQVIDWAQRQAGATLTYSIALVHDDVERDHLQPGHGRGLIWLVGMDGNDVARSPDEGALQARMLDRRANPAVIPTQDRMPVGIPDQ